MSKIFWAYAIVITPAVILGTAAGIVLGIHTDASPIVVALVSAVVSFLTVELFKFFVRNPHLPDEEKPVDNSPFPK